MNGKQLVKAIEKFREECDKAYSESDPFPVIEATIPIDAQKKIVKKYGDVVGNVIIAINELLEAVNEAQTDLDCQLDLLEYIATGLAESEHLAQQVADITQAVEPEHAGVGEEGDDDTSGRTKGD